MVKLLRWSFCQELPETRGHLYVACEYSVKDWQHLKDALHSSAMIKLEADTLGDD